MGRGRRPRAASPVLPQRELCCNVSRRPGRGMPAAFRVRTAPPTDSGGEVGGHGAPSSAGAGRKLRAPSRGGQERGGRRQSGGEARAAPGGAAPR